MKSAVLAIAIFMSSCELNESWYTDLAPGDAKTVEIAAMGQHVYRVHFPIAGRLYHSHITAYEQLWPVDVPL